jgi:hypothetical protein
MRRFKVKYVPRIITVRGPDGEPRQLEQPTGGHIFAVHVQNPADKKPAMIEEQGLWKFDPEIQAELEKAAGPIHVDHARTNGIIGVVVPEYCEPQEAQQIIEIAVRNALARFDDEGETPAAARMASYATRRLRELRGALKMATKKEAYEEAARLRDEIAQIESEANSSKE